MQRQVVVAAKVLVSECREQVRLILIVSIARQQIPRVLARSDVVVKKHETLPRPLFASQLGV